MVLMPLTSTAGRQNEKTISCTSKDKLRCCTGEIVNVEKDSDMSIKHAWQMLMWTRDVKDAYSSQKNNPKHTVAAGV